MNNELGAKIMTEFAELGPKTYSYVIDGGKATRTRKSMIKRRRKLKDKKNVYKIIKLF